MGDRRNIPDSDEDTTEQTEQICRLNADEKFDIVLDLIQVHTSEIIE